MSRTLKKPRRYACFPLRSVTIVVMDDATEHVATAHWPFALTTRFGDRNLLLEALMRTGRVEERDVIAHHASQMCLVDK